MVTGVGNMATVGNVVQQIPIKVEVTAPPVKSDRRSNKPIMEKRRRARINNCLNELKTLILDATKKDPARHSKLEKADILEKTVKHLQELQRQQAAMAQAADPKIVNKFKAGFTECANEVSRFPGLDTQVKRRLMQHLSNCINGVKSELNQLRQQQIISNSQVQQQQVHILPSPPSSPEQDHHQQQQQQQQQQMQQHNHHHHHQQQQQQQHIQTANTISMTQIQATANGYFLPNGIQVYPTKLSNGTFALILPQQQNVSQSTQLPMLVPIPSRTASTGSATSTQSTGSGYERTHSPIMLQQNHHYAPPSPANSYEAMDCQTNQYRHQQQQQHQMHHQTVIHHASASSSATINQQHHHQQQQQQQLLLRQTPDHYSQPSYSPEIEAGPLSLVMKKNNDCIKEEEQPCWRPW